MRTKFNVGDKVRVTEGYLGRRTPSPVNKTGEIIDKYMGFAQMVYVVRLDDGDTAVLYASEIKSERLAAWERALLGELFTRGENVTQDDLNYFEAGTEVLDNANDVWVKNSDSTWSCPSAYPGYQNRTTGYLFDPSEELVPFTFGEYPTSEPTHGYKVGDKVKITKAKWGNSQPVGTVGEIEYIHPHGLTVRHENGGVNWFYYNAQVADHMERVAQVPVLTNAEWIYLALSLNEAKNLGFPQAVDVHTKIMDYLGAR